MQNRLGQVILRSGATTLAPAASAGENLYLCLKSAQLAKNRLSPALRAAQVSLRSEKHEYNLHTDPRDRV